ncbi:DUF6221 family protein [Streptomyces sp. NPDC091281]|uniref:DUF6221 family protein n=1 Tax=Streptomyces sp. NPDC091281 TaxID=3365985 RepID=UPI0038186D6C
MTSVDVMWWLGEQLDEDELWAIEASRRSGGSSVEGGVHWRWMNTATDEEIVPAPERESYVGEMAEAAVDLRSRETWPTTSGVGELPQFAIRYSEEVSSAVGGHIVRHDPARVLREVDAKRALIARGGPFCTSNCGEPVNEPMNPDTNWTTPLEHHFDCGAYEAAKVLAAAYADRPGYREEWRP